MGLLDDYMTGFSNAILGPQGKTVSPSDTASAYQALQDELNNKYSQQEKLYNADPANKGKSWEAPDQFQRFRDQVDLMIKSGDPSLQKRGLALLSQPAADTSNRTANIKDYQYAVSQGYKGTFREYMDEKAKASRTSLTVNTGNQRGDYLTPEEKRKGGLDPNAAYVWTQDGPKPVATSKQSEEQKPINVAETTVNDLEDMLFGDQGLYKDYAKGTGGRISETIKANVQNYLQNDPRFAIYDNTTTASLSQLARSIGGEKGALAEGDVQRVKSLLPVVTGINPDTPQVAKQKLKRLQNLINLARQKGGLSSDEVKKYTTGFGGTITERAESNKYGLPAKTGGDGLPSLPEGFTWDD